MQPLETPPAWFVNLFTLGILRARWVAESNRRLGQGGAGFMFAWFFLAFAHYGLAERMTAALRQAGSSHTVSPLACFFLTGWPFIGSNARFKRGTAAYNDAVSVGSRANAGAVAPPAPPAPAAPAVPEVPPTTA
jgi:hypothetical protein